MLINNLVIIFIHFYFYQHSFVLSVNLNSLNVRTCDPIQIDMCKNLPYNVTGMPNFWGHEAQHEAKTLLYLFQPLIESRCSSILQFFLCSVFVPMCNEKILQPIGPCRSFCEKVRGRCKNVLTHFGYSWPDTLNCSRFPIENNDQIMCMIGPKEDATERYNDFFPPNIDHRTRFGNNNLKSTYGTKDFNNKINEPCSNHYTSSTQQCNHKCFSEALSFKKAKYFISEWMCCWSFACFLGTLIALWFFFKNLSSLKYPKRAIIFLSINYGLQSFGYFIRLGFGYENVACYYDPVYRERFLLLQGLENNACTFVFIFLYYFGMSAVLWYLTFGFTCLLESSGCPSSDLNSHCSIFFYHLISWGIPLIKTASLLTSGALAPDELTGLCYVSPSSEIQFVIVPLAVYSIIGLIINIAAGFRNVEMKIVVFLAFCLIGLGTFLIYSVHKLKYGESALMAAIKIFMSLVLGILACIFLIFERVYATVTTVEK